MSRKLTFAPQTDVGRERSENQDAFGSKHLDGLDFYIVCDGMGGHAGGSTASKLGIATIEDQLEQLDLEPEERIKAAIEAANAAIFETALYNRKLRGMGTTVVVLGIDHQADVGYIAHVGDSRIYRVRGDVMQRMTRDHTMVQRLVDDGILAPEDAENHPNANVISRSLGGHPAVEVELGPETLDLLEGDIFVLCSDGLSGLVSEKEIARVVTTMEPPEAAHHLIDRANQEGGHDNITVEIIRIGDQPEAVHDFQIVHPPRGPTTEELIERSERMQRAETAPAGEPVVPDGAPPSTQLTTTLDMSAAVAAQDAAAAARGIDGDGADAASPAHEPRAEVRRQKSAGDTAATFLLVLAGILAIVVAVLVVKTLLDPDVEPEPTPVEAPTNEDRTEGSQQDPANGGAAGDPTPADGQPVEPAAADTQAHDAAQQQVGEAGNAGENAVNPDGSPVEGAAPGQAAPTADSPADSAPAEGEPAAADSPTEGEPVDDTGPE